MAKIAVIGGGAAGMLAAGKAAQNGNEVHLFEKNDKLGKKIYITGKGRCNLTNQSDVESFMENIPGNPYFLYSALYGFDSEATISFFNELGLPTKTERGNRVFPVSDKAGDVVDALTAFLKKTGVKLHMNRAAASLLIEDSHIKGLRFVSKNEPPFLCDAVIVATGGLSYPGTGSTGDGYHMAKEAGHTVTKLYPSLVPLRCSEGFCADIMGLSLKNVKLTIKNQSGKQIFQDFGEMLFTHFGVSGPLVLSASRHLLGSELSGNSLLIDLKPALSEEKLDQRILRDFEKYSNKDFKNALDDLLPQKLIPIIIDLCKIDAFKKVREVTKEERKLLVKLLKNFTLNVTASTGYREAVVTSGGVCVDELNPSTMESKLVKGLYFAGEVIDVDAYTGGFNLQIAFSTGFLAGSSI